MPVIQTFILQFANEISPQEIPFFRGAVIASLKEKDVWFHNHVIDGVVYRYPRIQYKRIHRKAAIVCINEGIGAINELFNCSNFNYKIGNRDVEMQMESARTFNNDIGFCKESRKYRLTNWLPLNSDNYNTYQAIEGLADRIKFLEEKLIGNLLAFFTETGFHAEERIVLGITAITAQRLTRYKEVRLMAFDIEFKANLTLPQYIGIGKSASIGYGTLTRITN